MQSSEEKTQIQASPISLVPIQWFLKESLRLPARGEILGLCLLIGSAKGLVPGVAVESPGLVREEGGCGGDLDFGHGAF